MEIIEENNCFIFKSESINDFTIYINDKQIKVNKSLLMSNSDYFNAMFNKEWIETNDNNLRLEETLLKPFIIVLKFVYGFDFDDEEWDELRVQEINESLIVANKYQFNSIEKVISQKLVKKFPPINATNSFTSLTIWDLYEMSKMHNLLHLSNECLNYFDENADQVLKVIKKIFINPETILEIISRDSFGVLEMDLFDTIIDLMRRTRHTFNTSFHIFKKPFLKAIRFGLISYSLSHNEQFLKTSLSELFSESMISEALKDSFNSNKRISKQIETVFTSIKCSLIETSHIYSENLILSPNYQTFNEQFLAVKSLFVEDIYQELIPQVIPHSETIRSVIFTFELPLITKLNCIQFTIKSSKEVKDSIPMKYMVEVRDIESKNEEKWIQVVDYLKYSCIGSQELYFNELMTDFIRIICPSLRNKWKIDSIDYKYTRNPSKLLNGCVRPIDDNFVMNKTLSLLSFGEKEFIVKESDKKSIKEAMLSLIFISIIDNNHKQRANMYNTYYFMKCYQPFAIDCLQCHLKLETEFNSAKFEAFIEVLLLSNGTFGLNSHYEKVTKVSEHIIKESNTYNIQFDLQTVSAIKIFGFRFSKENNQLRIPLDISNVKVAVNRSSDEWINGKTLSLSSNNTEVNNFYSSFSPNIRALIFNR